MHVIRQLCEIREQAEGCPNLQLGAAGKAQHLLSKVGDDNLVFGGPKQETLIKNR